MYRLGKGHFPPRLCWCIFALFCTMLRAPGLLVLCHPHNTQRFIACACTPADPAVSTLQGLCYCTRLVFLCTISLCKSTKYFIPSTRTVCCCIKLQLYCAKMKVNQIRYRKSIQETVVTEVPSKIKAAGRSGQAQGQQAWQGSVPRPCKLSAKLMACYQQQQCRVTGPRVNKEMGHGLGTGAPTDMNSSLMLS